MPLIPITTIDDPRLLSYRELSQRNLTRQSGLFIAEGEKVVERLIASDFEVASLLAEPAFAERYAPQVPSETPIYVVSRDQLQATIGFNFHRGILACGRRRPKPRIPEFVAQLAGTKSTVVVCPNVHDPTNLGSIIRSTAAFGCDAILLGSLCADPFSRRVLRVSMGTALHLPILESSDLLADLGALAAEHYELVATVIDATAEPLATAQRTSRLALLLGSEAHGLGSQWLNLAHRRVTIPMHVGIDSLNVSVAAAVLLYHFCS